MAAQTTLNDAAETTAAQIDPSLEMRGEPTYTFLHKIQILLGMWDANPAASIKHRKLPEWNWVPNDDWRYLEGILGDRPEHDTTKMKSDNRALEEEQNARKFGSSRDR